MQCIYFTYIDFLAAEMISFERVRFQLVTDPRVFLLIDLHRFMNTRLVPFQIFSWSVIISIETFNKDVIVFSSLCNFLFVKHQK